jgi:hypothetical protein
MRSSGAPGVVKMVEVWTLNGGRAAAFQQHINTLRGREFSLGAA